MARRVSALPDDAFDQPAAAAEHRRAATRADRARSTRERRLDAARRRGEQHGRARARQVPVGTAPDPEPEYADAEQQAAYEDAFNGAHSAEHTRQLDEQPARPSRARRALNVGPSFAQSRLAPGTPTLGQVGARTRSVAQDSAGFVLGLLLYAVALNFVRGGGPQGVTAWLKAKFLNKATNDTPRGTVTPATPTAPAAPSSTSTGGSSGAVLVSSTIPRPTGAVSV